MPRGIVLTDQGTLELKELRANGLAGVTIVAPPALVGSYSIIMPTALPAALEFLAIDAAGQLSTAAGSATLDAAYDAGRIITADAGPVEAAGAGGFLASHTAPVYGLETTGAERNYRLTAGQTAGILEIQVGDADGDISDDVFATMLALDGGNQRLGFGTAAPVTLAHFVAPAGLDAVLRLDATIGMDAAVTLFEDGVSRWKIGYDDSAGGLVVGRLSFANPAIFVADTTGEVGIGTVAPLTRLHVFDAGGPDVAILESGGSGARIAFKDAATPTENNVYLQAIGIDLALFVNNSSLMHLDGADQRVGIGSTAPAGKLEVMSNTAAQIALLIDQDANGIGLTIDSEATAAPLINLLPLAGNTRGDIAFGTARIANPSAPSAGDVWYHSINAVLRYLAGTKTLAVGTNTYEVLADPGDAATFNVPANSNFIITLTNSTGAQTRTIGAPAFVGQRGIIRALFSGGGTTTALSDAGASAEGWRGGGTANDVATFNTSGQTMDVVAVATGEWRAVYADSGITFS